MATQEKPTIEKVVETFVYAPVGVALFVKDTMPTFMQMFVARGRNEVGGKVKDVGDQLGRARETGEHAVTFSSPMSIVTEIASRLEALRSHFDSAPEATMAATAPETPSSSAAPTAPTAFTETKWTAESADRSDAPTTSTPATPAAPTNGFTSPRADSSALAIPDYDELSASQVVERLDGLSPSDLVAIREYEESTRGRRTILGRIDTLTA